jgi:hypothetical protein
MYSRFYSAILAGVLAGTLCLTGLYGIAFYFIHFVAFSLLLAVSSQFDKGVFFLNKSTILTHGMFTNIMV